MFASKPPVNNVELHLHAQAAGSAGNAQLNITGHSTLKFDEFKEQKKELTPQLAEKTGSHLITRVGNVVVLYRPEPAKEES